MHSKIEHLRQDYSRASLDKSAVESDPVKQFAKWFAEAEKAEVEEPNAMMLATASRDGQPSARVVLLKGFDDDGFSFYTNYASRKGADILENPLAALTFWWKPLERQIRIEGRLDRVASAESGRYFSTRPRGSQLGAWASDQSAVISSRSVLEKNLEAIATRFADSDVERPPHWGGYVLKPSYFEFWQGRPSRLHDRIAYRNSDSKWDIVRLSP